MAERRVPQFEKSSPELVARFAAATVDLPGIETRKMFGYPAAFANGHMFSGLFGEHWFVRVDDARDAELRGLGATSFEVMPGRAMHGYLVVPEDIAADPIQAAQWVARALGVVLSLPPKPGR